MKALAPWRPRRELERIEHRMRDLFDRFWDESFFSSWDRLFRKVKAHYKDGLLKITMPTPKDLAAKKIQIEASK